MIIKSGTTGEIRLIGAFLCALYSLDAIDDMSLADLHEHYVMKVKLTDNTPELPPRKRMKEIGRRLEDYSEGI